MGYKNKEKQRAFGLAWLQKRRMDWFSKNGPCVRCGSWLDLELDHIDPSLKVSHRVWSWTETKRNMELAKCQVLCQVCHLAKTIKERAVEHIHGTTGMYKTERCRCVLCRKANAIYEAKRRGSYMGRVSVGGSTSHLQCDSEDSNSSRSTYSGVEQ